MASQDEIPNCTKCNKPQSELPNKLKPCAKCHNSRYCSRTCQKADWKAHKPSCGNYASEPANPNNGQPDSGSGVPVRAPATPAPDVFAPDAMQLERLPDDQAFDRIIDCYRMRAQDESVFRQTGRGVYIGDCPLRDFRQFLRKAEKRGDCLPSWWSKQKSRACERHGMNPNIFSYLGNCIEMDDIMLHYDDAYMPLMMRVLAQKIESSYVIAPRYEGTGLVAAPSSRRETHRRMLRTVLPVELGGMASEAA